MDFLNLARNIYIFEQEPEIAEAIGFLSRIEAIGKRSIFICPPYEKGRYWHVLQVGVGEIVFVRVDTEKCSYVFQAQLLSISTVPPELWELSLPTIVKRIQRRRHVRLAIIIEVKIKFINRQTEFVSTFTKDISAGGLQVMLDEPPPENSGVKVFLPLDNTIIIEAKGEIIRVTSPEILRRRFAVAIKFSEIAREKQEQITKYIFHKEVERRKREKALFEEDADY